MEREEEQERERRTCDPRHHQQDPVRSGPKWPGVWGAPEESDSEERKRPEAGWQRASNATERARHGEQVPRRQQGSSGREGTKTGEASPGAPRDMGPAKRDAAAASATGSRHSLLRVEETTVTLTH